MNALRTLMCLLFLALFTTQPALVAHTPASPVSTHVQEQPADQDDHQDDIFDDLDDDDNDDHNSESMRNLSRWGQFKNWLDDLRFKAKIGSRVGRKYFDNWYNQQRGREILAVTLLSLGAFGTGFGFGHSFADRKHRNKNKSDQN